MKALIQFLNNILYRYDIEVAEMQSILAKLSFALVLFGVITPSGLHQFTQFVIANSHFGIPVFCVIALATGLLHLIGMVKDNIEIRRLAAFTSVMTWTFLTATLITQGIPVVTLLSGTFVLSSALVYLRLTGILNKRSFDRKTNNERNDTHHCLNTGGTAGMDTGTGEG
jgi:hypothetical protein